MIIHIDEAGRGPVLGPMVMAGIIIDEKKIQGLGVKDSKLLTKNKREQLYDSLISLATDYSIETVFAHEIDNALKSASSNLNMLEALMSARIINRMHAKKVIIDLPDRNKERYEFLIRKDLNKDVEFVLEHKADAKYPGVGAASILAKVTRDRYMAKLEKETGLKLGSGYMTDRITTDFLSRNWNKKHPFIRYEWESVKRLKRERNQSKLGWF